MRNQVIAVLIAGLVGIAVPMSANAQREIGEGSLALGAVFQQGGSISPNANYSGAAVQFWPMINQALQLGVAIETEGARNVSLHGEYQMHFLRTVTDRHSLFVGGGFFYEDSPGDDWIALYAPLGFRIELPNYPVSFMVNTSVRLFIDPDTSLEIFDEVRLGAFYSF